MNRGTRGERPQQRLRKWQGRCGGAPHAGCGGMHARAIRGNANSVGGGKPGATPARQAWAHFFARYETAFTKTHIKPRLLQKHVLSGHCMRRCRGHNSIFTTQDLLSCIIARWKTSRWHVFPHHVVPPTLRRNPISAFSVGRHALGAAACTIPGCPEQHRVRCSLAPGE